LTDPSYNNINATAQGGSVQVGGGGTEATVSLSPANASVEKGHTVDQSIVVNADGSDIGSFGFSVSYGNAVSVEEVTAANSAISLVVNDLGNSVTIAGFAANGVNSGEVAVITWRGGNSNGTANIGISITDLTDTGYNNINATAYGGSVEVGGGGTEPTVPPDTAVVSLNPANAEVNPNQTVDQTISIITDGSDIGSFGLSVSYGNAVSVESVTAANSAISLVVNDLGDSVTIAGFAATGVSSGDVATITWRAGNATDTANIGITVTDLTDPSYNNINATAQNGSVHIGTGPVITDPPTIEPTTPPAGSTTTYQFEDGTWNNAIVQNQHAGYTGTGYVNTDNAAGNWTQLTVQGIGGQATLEITFANGGSSNRSATLEINGSIITSALAFDDTGYWTDYDSIITTVYLVNGSNTVRFIANTSDGLANMDMMVVTTGGGTNPTQAPPTQAPPTQAPPTQAPPTQAPPTQGPPTQAPPTEPPVTTITYQFEDGTWNNAIVQDEHNGFSGTGYVNTDNAVDNWVEVTVQGAGGSATLEITIANGSSSNRSATLAVNGVVIDSSLAFENTGYWTSYDDVTTTVDLTDGSNTIRFTANTSGGLPNMDQITVTTGGSIQPTQVPPTQAPPTQAPPTQAPPTQAPPTQAPPTQAPPTQAPPTDPPPTDAPTGVGDVRLSPANVNVDVGNQVKQKITVNSGSSDIGSWGFTVTYPSYIDVVSVTAATSAASLVVNTDVDGQITIGGFAATGINGGNAVAIAEITWQGVSNGIATVGLGVTDLTDTAYATLGTPNGQNGSVDVSSSTQPTDPPTAPPTDPPTAPPTDPPTAPPTDPPTAPPTDPPTAPPTDPPTAPPTDPPTAPPTDPPTAPPNGPGTLFLSPGNVNTTNGSSFTITGRGNTGNSILAAYGALVSFNKNVINANTVSAATGAFMSAAMIDNDAGTANISGFDTNGVGPNTDIALFNISFSAVGSGSTTIAVNVDTFVDGTYVNIGTPAGAGATVNVN
jgi:hypothetical protein